MEKVVINYVKAALRRTWGRSTQRRAALKKARVERGKYKCACCGEIVQRKNIEVDHIKPVGRFEDFDTYIERLFCPTKELQILCLQCHRLKSKNDNKK
jgi:5-methylcytosine-specific restriction endonuclease McrA